MQAAQKTTQGTLVSPLRELHCRQCGKLFAAHVRGKAPLERLLEHMLQLRHK